MPRVIDQEARKVVIFVRLITRLKPSDETIQRLIGILKVHASWKSARTTKES